MQQRHQKLFFLLLSPRQIQLALSLTQASRWHGTQSSTAQLPFVVPLLIGSLRNNSRTVARLL